MTLMYSLQHRQTVEVPDPLVKDHERKGYIIWTAAHQPLVIGEDNSKPAEPEDSRIFINKAESDELTVLPGIGIATAKKIIDARPIASFAELKTKIPTVDWSVYSEAFNYELPEAQPE